MNRRARLETAMKSIPFERIDQKSGFAIRDVLDNPSFYRQLPQRMLDCDPQLLAFMVRNPEVMVNIWEIVGITNIVAKRTGQYTFFADDGAGTKCNCELVYSDNSTHIYYGTGTYDGMLLPRTIKGRVVCVLRSQAEANRAAQSGFIICSTMDVFLKVDNLGADLLTRTLGPLVGKVTEHNFEETSKFVCQFSEFCVHNPRAARTLASQLNISSESIRQEFIAIASRIGNQGNVARSPASELPVVVQRSTLDEQPAVDLKNSLGHIRLATLPELMTSPENSSDFSVNSAETLELSEAANRSNTRSVTQSFEHDQPSNLEGFDRSPPTETRRGAISPQRSGVNLRR